MTDELDPGAYIGHEPERVPRREADGDTTIDGRDLAPSATETRSEKDGPEPLEGDDRKAP